MLSHKCLLYELASILRSQCGVDTQFQHTPGGTACPRQNINAAHCVYLGNCARAREHFQQLPTITAVLKHQTANRPAGKEDTQFYYTQARRNNWQQQSLKPREVYGQLSLTMYLVMKVPPVCLHNVLDFTRYSPCTSLSRADRSTQDVGAWGSFACRDGRTRTQGGVCTTRTQASHYALRHRAGQRRRAESRRTPYQSKG